MTLELEARGSVCIVVQTKICADGRVLTSIIGSYTDEKTARLRTRELSILFGNGFDGKITYLTEIVWGPAE